MVVIVAKACLTPMIPGPVAHQAPLSIGFPRWEYWSGSPFPSPGDLPNPRDWTCICCIGSQMLYHWATREAPFPRGCLQTLVQYLRPSSSDMIPEASHELRLHHLPWFHLRVICLRVHPYSHPTMLRSFNGPEPGGLESTDKKVKERERGWYSLVYTESQ